MAPRLEPIQIQGLGNGLFGTSATDTRNMFYLIYAFYMERSFWRLHKSLRHFIRLYVRPWLGLRLYFGMLCTPVKMTRYMSYAGPRKGLMVSYWTIGERRRERMHYWVFSRCKYCLRRIICKCCSIFCREWASLGVGSGPFLVCYASPINVAISKDDTREEGPVQSVNIYIHCFQKPFLDCWRGTIPYKVVDTMTTLTAVGANSNVLVGTRAGQEPWHALNQCSLNHRYEHGVR